MTIPVNLQWAEKFDVGADTGTPVGDEDYQVPFRFTGTLAKPLRLSPLLRASSGQVLEAVREFGLEGVVGKRIDSTYEPGDRRTLKAAGSFATAG